MTLRDEIAVLRARIARVESDRDTWQSSGRQEKYIEAACVAETLELQLEQLRQEGQRATARNAARAASSDEQEGEKP